MRTTVFLKRKRGNILFRRCVRKIDIRRACHENIYWKNINAIISYKAPDNEQKFFGSAVKVIVLVWQIFGPYQNTLTNFIDFRDCFWAVIRKLLGISATRTFWFYRFRWGFSSKFVKIRVLVSVPKFVRNSVLRTVLFGFGPWNLHSMWVLDVRVRFQLNLVYILIHSCTLISLHCWYNFNLLSIRL